MDVSKAEPFTIHRYFDLRSSTLPVVNLGTADASGLVADPNNPGIFSRPGVVNLSPSPPAGAPAYHTYNWGGYGSIQATPQPPQIIDNNTIVAGVDGGEIIIAPAQDTPTQQSASPVSLKTAIPNATAISTTGERVDTKV